MSEKFEAAKASLEYLSTLKIEQINNQANVKHLHNIVRGLNVSKESDDSKWSSETKLLDFPDVFLKVYYAAERMKRIVEPANIDSDFTQEILSIAILVLNHATFVSVSFRKVFYTKGLALYLLNILARDFQDINPDLTNKKHLDYGDAETCMLTILTTMLTEARLGEQIQQHLGMDVAQRFFQSKLVNVALSAYALCSYITTNTTGNELQIPDNVLFYLLDMLVNALTGRKVYLIASGSLLRLQKLILCSDDFNQKVMKCKDFYVLDILTNILESPEPPNAADVQMYQHESIANTSESANHVFTTYLEKERAAATCWALLLSEQHYHENAEEMLKHESLIDALKVATEKPNKKLSDTAKGVLWQLQRNKPQQHAQNEPTTQPSETDAANQKLLSRRSSAGPNIVAKSPTVPDTPGDAKDGEANAVGDQTTAERPNTAASSARLPSAKPTDRLKSAEKRFAHGSLSPLPKSDKSKKTVMISYSSHCRPKLVHRINKSLQHAKIDTWIYNEKLDGDIYSAMAKAIEECSVVLVCYSNEYSNSDPCHAELNYTRRLKKPAVFVRLEKFTPFGWLGTSTAGINYHDFASSEFDDGDEGESYKARISKLIAELSKYVLES